MKQRHRGYWSEERIIDELKAIVDELNHFPLQMELKKIKKGYLVSTISKHGGFNYFRELLGYKLIYKPDGYWNEKTIVTELEPIIENLDHFPTKMELKKVNRNDLITAIGQHGGSNYFRELLGYKLTCKPDGYWNEETITCALKLIIKKIKRFPTETEIKDSNIKGLNWAISQHGGLSHFWKLFGIETTTRQENTSEMSSYVSKRGSNSEKIVKELITKWCHFHNLPQPQFNVKLAKSNIIEFVCETNKRIGVDVTNTKKRGANTIKHKWRHKQYHLHLDELWVVVFSDVFTEYDYIKFNNQSPENVKVMSVNTFMEELGITVDDNLKLKIENYNACTFHNKDELSAPKVGLGKFFKIKPDIKVGKRF